VPLDYDPLLAKLIGFGETRQQAIARLKRAVDEYFIGGVKTNVSLFRRILTDPAFAAGNTDTGYLTRLPVPTPAESPEREQELAAIVAAVFAATDSRHALRGNGSATPASSSSTSSNWKRSSRAEALRSEALR